MSSLIAEILPLALAIALSPFPIIPAILLLFTAQARSNSIAFLAGWFSGILVGELHSSCLHRSLNWLTSRRHGRRGRGWCWVSR